jgi:hypothetical protein
MAKVAVPTSATFKAQYPEFGALDDSVCDAFLADAAQDFDSALFPGRDGTMGVMAQAAHLLALSPAGRPMELVSKSGSTVYGDRVAALKRRKTMGMRP